MLWWVDSEQWYVKTGLYTHPITSTGNIRSTKGQYVFYRGSVCVLITHCVIITVKVVFKRAPRGDKIKMSSWKYTLLLSVLSTQLYFPITGSGRKERKCRNHRGVLVKFSYIFLWEQFYNETKICVHLPIHKEISFIRTSSGSARCLPPGHK